MGNLALPCVRAVRQGEEFIPVCVGEIAENARYVTSGRPTCHQQLLQPRSPVTNQIKGLEWLLHHGIAAAVAVGAH